MLSEFLVRSFVKNRADTSDPAVRIAYGRLSGAVGIACNLLLSAGKFAAAVFSGSFAVMADAVNNLSDASSSVVSLVGFKIAGKPADHEHPYGHARSEYLAGLIVALLVLVAGVELMKSGVGRILHPEPLRFSWGLAAALAASVFVKLWMYLFYRKNGRLIASGALLSAAADSRNDVLATSAVLASSLLSHFADVSLDGWMGAGIAGFILFSGWGLVRDTLDPLLGKAPDPQTAREIQKRILGYPGVLGTHDLLIHDYGPGRRFGSVHVEMAAEGDPIANHDVIDGIERDFLKNESLDLVVHLDPIVTSESAVGDLRLSLSGLVKSVHPDMSIHDLRVVPGTTHTKLVFDCVVPPEMRMKQAEIRRTLSRLVAEKYPDHYCAITFDSSYAAIPHNG